jgi:NADH-quinone oxidoreductase subunit N
MITLPVIDWTIVAQLLVVFGGATVLLLLDLAIPAGRKQVTAYLALLVVLGAAAVGVMHAGVSGATFGGTLRLDPFRTAVGLVCLAAAALSILLAVTFLGRHQIERGEFAVLVLFGVGGMLLLVQAADLVVMFLGLALLSITLYVLAGFALPEPRSEEAALKYLLTGAFATGFLVFGIALIYGATGSTTLATIAAAGPGLTGEYRLYAAAGLLLLVVGLGYKASLVPFHMWTPDVYDGAPTPVAAFMSVASKAAVLAALTHVLLVGFGELRALWAPILAVVAAATLLVGNIGALVQQNVKRMLAYSSIGQAGFLLFGPIAASDRGIDALVFYLASYTVANLAAFAVLIALEARGETEWSMARLSGLWQRSPGLTLVLALALLSLAGVPPTAGFIAKFAMLDAVWQAGYPALVVLGVVTSAIAAAYYLRVLLRAASPAETDAPPMFGDWPLRLGMALAALAIVVLGLAPGWLLSFS